MQPIVAAVDGSDGSAAALRWARRESVLHGTSLTAVMTWGSLDQHHPDGGTETRPGYDQAAADAALDAFVVAALGEEAARDVARLALDDLAVPGLVGASTDAGLLVVGARGLGGFRGLLVGSVSQGCLAHATCPVAVVRDVPQHDEGSTERIVVGIDGSPAATAALGWALDEARARQARLDVVHAWSSPSVVAYPGALSIDSGPFEAGARHMVTSALDHADVHGLARPPEPIVAVGGASGVLLDVAEGADLVVVGSHGVGGFRGMLLGSVSHHVSDHAPCPVVVIRRSDS